MKVIDFGLAKVTQEAGMASLQQLTQEGMAIGSVKYMSPEQCHGQIVDGRSDLYALGCLLHHCLTGSPPFDDDNTVAVMLHHVNHPAPRLVAGGESDQFVGELQNYCAAASLQATQEKSR